MRLFYLIPPLGLLAFGVWMGHIDSVIEVASNLIRYVLVCFASIAIMIGLSNKLKYLSKDGFWPEAVFFLGYVAVFFVLNIALGVELMHQDPSEPWIRP